MIRGFKLALALAWLVASCSKPAFVGIGSVRVPAAADGGKPQAAGTGSAAGGPSLGAATAAAEVSVERIDHSGPDNPAGLKEPEIARLKAGGPLGTLRFLYPYSGTIFPRDTRAPLLMWEGVAQTEAVYLQIHSTAFDYRAILVPARASGSNSGLGAAPQQPQLRIPEQIWERANAQTRGKGDVFRLELTTWTGGVVAGPISSEISIADASFKGSIYYTNYFASQGAVAFGSGSLIRIPPRGEAQLVAAGGTGLGGAVVGACTGCHSVSANGSRVITQWMNIGASGADAVQGLSSWLSVDAGQTDMLRVASWSAFPALYPDGSKYLVGGLPRDPNTAQIVGPAWNYAQTAIQLMSPVAAAATLYDSLTGQVVPDTGIPAAVLMPMFSPDATHLVFNDYAIDQGRGLAAMRYDAAAHKASDYRLLMREDAASETRPGWPAFLPDNGAVVTVRTDSADFAGRAAGGRLRADFSMDRRTTDVDSANADLFLVDVETGEVNVLAKAMGLDAAGLPFPSDLHHNYTATVAPTAAGGYFWVFFDSLRNYGNLGLQHQLWGTAIDISPDGHYQHDSSHPAFYLEGQETAADNIRAFAALDRCRDNRERCSNGVDCCSGFCSAALAVQDGVCTPARQGCSNRDERCASAADCCIATDYCINGFCAYVDLQ